MVEVGAFEAKNKLGSLLNRVEQGEEILITRHGKPVAQLSRPSPVHTKQWTEEDAKQADEAYARMRARARDLKMGPFDWEEYKKWRDEGRP